MLSIKLICVGRLKDRFYTDAANEYLKRLSGYCKVEVVEIPESRLPENPSQSQIIPALEKESALIEKSVGTGVFSVAACISGKEMTSEELSNFIEQLTRNGISRLCFIIGGSHGLHEIVKQRASLSISMSKMTFPHTLARVMLLEQLYRAFKISKGGKYHK